jgi:hypothetical protein
LLVRARRIRAVICFQSAIRVAGIVSAESQIGQFSAACRLGEAFRPRFRCGRVRKISPCPTPYQKVEFAAISRFLERSAPGLWGSCRASLRSQSSASSVIFMSSRV